MGALKEKNLRGTTGTFALGLTALMDNKDGISPLGRKVQQKELAKVLGCKRQVIGCYMNGKYLPDLERFKRIADFFGASYDFLLGKTNAVERKNYRIASDTGLSDEAIRVLTNFKSDADMILDTNSDFFECEQIGKMQAQQTLTLLNILISEDYLPWMAISIWSYAEKVKQIKRKIKALKTLEELKSKLGDDFVLMDHQDLLEEVGDNEMMKGVQKLPNNGPLLVYVIKSLEDELDYQEWSITKSQTDFALNAAKKIMDSVE